VSVSTGAPGERVEPRLRNHRDLLVLAIALPVVEAAVLWARGLTTSVALAPQITAPAPFAVFHDLRWLLVYHSSWPTFAAESLVALGFRVAVVAAFVRAAWPYDNGPPDTAGLVRHAASFTLAAEILLLPFAALLFGLAVAPVSWLFFAGVPGALVVALLIHHGVTTSHWWRDAPPLRSAGWIALTFLVLTVVGAVISVSPAAFRLPIAAAAGLFNAWAWLGIVRVLAGRPRGRIRPVAPVGIALMLAAALLSAFIALAGHRQGTRLRQAQVEAAPSGRPVLIVGGFNSSWDGERSDDLLGDGFDERQFSYRGLDARGRPLPYVPNDTHRSLPVLVREMAREVEALRAATGQDVDIVADSEGSIIAAAYVLAAPDSPVRRTLLLSPLVEPGRVSFPERGEDGWGVATGWVLRGASAAVRAMTSVELAPDSPFTRTLVDEAPVLRGLLRCPPPGTDELALVPLADAVVSAHPSALAIDDSVVPAFHGGGLEHGTIRKAVALALDGEELPDLSVWSSAERLVSIASAAWQAPTLPLTVGWDVDRAADCGEVTARLREWLRPQARSG
jgi:hypothetical protein